MTVNRGTVRAILLELGGITVTDEELDALVPAVQAYVDSIAKLDAELDLTQVPPGLVFRADPGR